MLMSTSCDKQEACVVSCVVKGALGSRKRGQGGFWRDGVGITGCRCKSHDVDLDRSSKQPS